MMFQNPHLPEGERGEDMIAPCKRRAQSTLPHPQLTTTPDNIGEYIARDARMVRDLVWEEFVKKRRGHGEFAYLGGVDHTVRHLLRQYWHRGCPVVFPGHRWKERQQR